MRSETWGACAPGESLHGRTGQSATAKKVPGPQEAQSARAVDKGDSSFARTRGNRRLGNLATAQPGADESRDGQTATGHHELSADGSGGAQLANRTEPSRCSGADLHRAWQAT